MTKHRHIECAHEIFPLAKPFRISRGVKTGADLVRVSITDSGKTGAGECCPYGRYGESVETVLKTIKAAKGKVEGGVTRDSLQTLLPPGAARNAIDCALWDIEAKLIGKSVADLTGFPPLKTFSTMRTVVIDTPVNMAAEAASYPKGSTIKVKLDMEDVEGRLKAIRKGAPKSPIVVDANEGWDGDFLAAIMPKLETLGVVLLEQPLLAGRDEILSKLKRVVPVCADESCHTRADLGGLIGRYDAVNIKLDKTGGLTEALALLEEAAAGGFKIMLGCMVSSSLSIAPIAHLCSHADYIDLDGPLLLRTDREDGMKQNQDGSVTLNSKWGQP